MPGQQMTISHLTSGLACTCTQAFHLTYVCLLSGLSARRLDTGHAWEQATTKVVVDATTATSPMTGDDEIAFLASIRQVCWAIDFSQCHLSIQKPR